MSSLGATVRPRKHHLRLQFLFGAILNAGGEEGRPGQVQRAPGLKGRQRFLREYLLPEASEVLMRPLVGRDQFVRYESDILVGLVVQFRESALG